MNQPDRPSLTVFYQPPENMPLEEKIMDLADNYAESLLYPFQETNEGIISVRFLFPDDKSLLEFKKSVVDVAFARGIYIHFGP